MNNFSSSFVRDMPSVIWYHSLDIRKGICLKKMLLLHAALFQGTPGWAGAISNISTMMFAVCWLTLKSGCKRLYARVCAYVCIKWNVVTVNYSKLNIDSPTETPRASWNTLFLTQSLLMEQFLRASAMLKHVIDIGCTSVRLSICHTLVLYQNGWIYCHAFFITR